MPSKAYQPVPDPHSAKLSKGMEHLRLAVSIDAPPRKSPHSTDSTPTPSDTSASTPTSTSSPDNSDLTTSTEQAYGVPSSFQPLRRPANRSHDPSNNQKRSDPFQFGSRYLEEGDDIFEFNAWDHVEVDEEYKRFAEERYKEQKESKVGEWDMNRFNTTPSTWWNKFYTHNTWHFFKNRKWLVQEFPILTQLTSTPSAATILELGAGAGNTALPLLAMNRNPDLTIHAVDYSPRAIDVIKSSAAYIADAETHIKASVWDLSTAPDGPLPDGVAANSVDVVLLIFCLSALDPETFPQAVRNVWRMLKPGGEVCFRDYGRGDLAQVRFKRGRWMGEGWYVRGDGTRVFFAEEEEMRRLWRGVRAWRGGEGGGDGNLKDGVGNGGHERESRGEEGEKDGVKGQDHDRQGSLEKQEEHVKGERDASPEQRPTDEEDWRPKFEILNLGVDRRMLVNRQRKIKMYRCWIQGRFRKPLV